MTAPTLTVTAAPTVHKSQSFSCQSTSQANPGHAQPQPTDSTCSSSSLFPNDQQHQQNNRLTSKSLSNLPAAAALDFDLPSLDFDTGIDFDPTLPVSRKLQLSPNEKTTLAPTAANLEGPRPRTDKMGRRKSILGRPHSWVPTSKATPDIRPASEKSTEPNGHVKTTETQNQTDNKKEASGSGLLQPPTERTGGSLSSLARRSWISSSKTPSPSANATESSDYVSHASRERSLSTSSNKLKKLTRKRQGSTNDNEGSKSSDSLGKLGSFMGKMKQRPQNGLSKGAAQHDTDSAASSITSSAPASTTTRPSNAASDNTFPSVVVEEAARPPTAQARDPLWSVFKNLESEYGKFQGKKPAEKMRHVRTVLIPFLRGHASHPSTKKLTLEHVEQRANILHKWWNGLLELLDGPSQGAVPGTDRSTLHEVTTLVMMRPEWRLNTPNFRPLTDRNLGETSKHSGQPQAANAANDSGSSADSDFIAESAEHNVRTMFTSNLMRQMAIVVDKMSQRHMPWSMINFAGKACAYAFFFVPGVADVLVSLWSLTTDLLRRVADEFHLQRRSRGDSDDIVAVFPPNLSRLGWTSVKGMTQTLREPTKLSHTAAKINWNGPWMARWRGRDTDLFFIFCKYYFILAEEFIPAELALAEKSRIPAFVLVNAQILSALDSTVHRQAAFNAMAFPSADGIDATATALPIAPNNNVMKGMTENRLIVLLKDFLSASSVAFMAARHTFAEAFMALMKASAKRTSLFDHNACFTLCDFLEESLVAYDGYVDVHRPTLEYIDWPFWIDVCRKMMASSNAGSEVRVLSLIFSIWDAIVSNPSRKELVCLDWLLQEEIFYKWFNNWCPMVRAYYMRLVCWRMCRNTGSPSELDTKIFAVVNSRLKTVWSHYLWLKQEAESKGKVPPSTAPCWPTPGKRFVIIRTEVTAAQSGLMMGFDSFQTPMGPLESTASPPSPRGSAEMSAVEPAAYKKKWNLFGKVLSFGSTSGVNDLETIRRETAAARKHTTPSKSSETPTPPASDTDSLGSSPTYEALQYVFRFTLQWHSQGATAPLGRILTRPRLPAPAQLCVNAQSRHDDGGPLPPLPPSRPAATRAFSGSANSGLIDAAKNANPGDVSPTTVRTMMQYAEEEISVSLSPIEHRNSNGQSPWSSPQIATSENLVGPVKPPGIYMQSSTYSGRALAEWSTVVAECNSFTDRRREEGVLSLEEVEVPALGVEGFRKIG